MRSAGGRGLETLVSHSSHFHRGRVTHRHPEKRASLVAQLVKNLPAYAGDTRDAGSIPGLGRSPGGGHGNPFQCSCLENPWAEETGDYSQWGHKEWDTTEHAPREERPGKNTPNLSLPFTHSFTFSFFQTVSGAHSFRSILLPRMPPRFLHTVSREGLLLFFFFDDHFKSLYWMCYNISSVLCFLLFWHWGMWGLSSLPRDRTCILLPLTGRGSLKHWIAREVPGLLFWL